MSRMILTELESMIVREVQAADGEPSMVRGLLDLASLRAELDAVTLVSVQDLELVAQTATAVGFRRYLPKFSEAEAITAAYRWPDILPDDRPIPRRVLYELFERQGEEDGQNSLGWYRFNTHGSTR